ncbi:MAG: hypothetical protein LR015_06115 [Verrucomicrobia bacterium]|nr:hypothetical protein [Verrucomicrobiota bacterium]
MKTKEEWLDTMELRLRRAYLDVADMDEAEAMHFLEQEMRSHLDDVQGEALRRDYMLSLRERFPLMLSEKGLLSAGDLATAIPSTPKEQLDNALEVLKQQWPALDEAERQAFLESIDTSATARGPAGERQSETLSSPSDEMARFLKLAETSVISDERLQEVFLILLKTLCQIDALGTQFYKQLGLNREISQEDIRKLLGGYVSGDAVSMDAINKALNETRLKVGPHYQCHCQPFQRVCPESPGTIPADDD